MNWLASQQLLKILKSSHHCTVPKPVTRMATGSSHDEHLSPSAPRSSVPQSCWVSSISDEWLTMIGLYSCRPTISPFISVLLNPRAHKQAWETMAEQSGCSGSISLVQRRELVGLEGSVTPEPTALEESVCVWGVASVRVLFFWSKPY